MRTRATISALTDLFDLSEEDLAKFHERLKQHRNFEQVTLRYQLTDQEVARFSVNRHRFPGVDVVGRLIRHYPQGPLFAHAVGYVGRINQQDLLIINPQNYKGTLQIGKTGVEKQYEDLLHGTVGHRQVETNVQGRTVRELKSVPSQPGQDLYLHLDVELQRTAAEALKGYNGSVVAMDPADGSVLALYSAPTFDPNAFGTRFFINDVGQNAWEEIDLGKAGADYGWNVREGTHCFDPDNPTESPEECPTARTAGWARSPAASRK